MVKDSTIAILALGGAGLYFLSKSNFFKGLGEVGTGVGEATAGLGSGISTIGREAGDIVVDVGSVLEPFAAGFQGTANLLQEAFIQQQNSLRREGQQADIVDTSAFAASKDVLSSIQAERDINTAREKATRKGLIQGELTQLTRFATTADDRIRDVFGGILKNTGVVLGGISAEFSKALRRDKPISFTTEGVSGGSIILPVQSSSSSSSRSASVRSSGGGSSANMSRAYYSPVPINMSVAPSTNKSSSLRNTVTSTISTAATKAKGLLSSAVKKIRSIF